MITLSAITLSGFFCIYLRGKSSILKLIFLETARHRPRLDDRRRQQTISPVAGRRSRRRRPRGLSSRPPDETFSGRLQNLGIHDLRGARRRRRHRYHHPGGLRGHQHEQGKLVIRNEHFLGATI